MTIDNLAPKRVLVLGATGFLGPHVIEALLARGHAVTALVRGKPVDSEFVRRRLFDQVRISGGDLSGDIRDAIRLRQILQLHEIDAIIQCAASSGNAALTHVMTRTVLTAASRCAAPPMVIVPLRAADAMPPRFESFRGNTWTVVFITLPELFGTGDVNADRYAPRLFAAAASGDPLPFPDVQLEWLDATSASEHLVNAMTTARADSLGPVQTAAAAFTALQLRQAVRDGDPRLEPIIEWYRQNAHRIPARTPVLRVAA